MSEKVLFDGTNRLILVKNGIVSISFKEDVYSAQKRWMVDNTTDNQKYLHAIEVVGGDPITETLSVGTTFFLANGQRLRPYSGNHTLQLFGNVYTREGDVPIVNTVGSYNVLVNMKTSNLIDTVNISGGTGGGDPGDIAEAVWSRSMELDTNSGTYGWFVKKILTVQKFLGLK